MAMSEIEAKSKIKHRIAVVKEIAGTRFDRKIVEDLEIAIQALKEIREYREIGTVEELKAFRSNDFTQDLLNMGYTKGLKDGYAKAVDEFAENLRPLLNTYADRVRLDEVAEYLKGGATDEC